MTHGESIVFSEEFATKEKLKNLLAFLKESPTILLFILV